MPRNVENPFSPVNTRKETTSAHHKTILNKSYVSAKRGLDASDHRDFGAFRSKKYRAMKKLHSSKEWANMSLRDKHEAEKKIVSRLEEEWNAKKREHEREWFKKVENGEIKAEEDETMAHAATSSEVKGDDENDDWVTDEEDKGSVSNRELRSLIDGIKKKSGKGYLAKLRYWEDVGKQKEKERLSGTQV